VKIDGVLHKGLGVHAGRFGKPDGAHHLGPFHSTHGCVRTSEQAMRLISAAIAKDPLGVLEIRNNGNRSR
jgi:hypothetical protein